MQKLTPPIDKDLLLILGSSELGNGEPDLGSKLMGLFLKMLVESETLPAKIICINSGIFLCVEGSPVLDLMKKFEDAGTKIFSCGTCLDYYKQKDLLAVGEPGNMKDTVQSMLTFKKILKP